ncbi:hypothetical protein CPB83DRAFT_194365 [Crepidotus variabilis]|uniref:Uncharacterized protein n=1 Tax=Crepidotus variabilis TaxID=179855 RepID=A0A9P6JHX3_9AGAR|nr:hypothetical protein CPB83DRAFT_194365 [Crepidotus variabilis]
MTVDHRWHRYIRPLLLVSVLIVSGLVIYVLLRVPIIRPVPHRLCKGKPEDPMGAYIASSNTPVLINNKLVFYLFSDLTSEAP